MKRLFLSSFFSGVADLFVDFTGNDCAGKKVVFIPTASIVEKVNFYVKSDLKALERLGMVVDELEVSTASPDEIESKIANADYVFVEGGNTFFLLQELRSSGADRLISEHIEKGKTYIGASAGSMVVSKDIEYVRHMDKPDVAPRLEGCFSALGAIDFCVVPHCTNFPFKKAAEKIIKEYSESLNLYPISNDQAVVVNGDVVEVVTVKKKGGK